jgi:hypothetical protein
MPSPPTRIAHARHCPHPGAAPTPRSPVFFASTSPPPASPPMCALLPPDARVLAPIRLPPTTRARSAARSWAPLARRPRQAALALRCPRACGVPRRRGVRAVRGAGVTPSRCHGPAGRSSSTGSYSSHPSSDRRAPPFTSAIHAPPDSWPHHGAPFLPLP